MGLQLNREKPGIWSVSAAYWFNRLLPLSPRSKMRFFLDLEWIFDRLSHELSFSVYGPDSHPFREDAVQFIGKNLAKSDVVLDLGCKEGDISAAIVPYANKVVGVDTDAAAIEIAKKKHRNPALSFMVEDGLRYLTSHPKDFSVCILSNVLEHQDDPVKFLKSLAPYFKSFYVEVPDYDRYYLNRYRKDLGNQLVWSDNDHVFEFDRNELNRVIAEAGFKIEEAVYRFGTQKLWLKKSA